MQTSDNRIQNKQERSVVAVARGITIVKVYSEGQGIAQLKAQLKLNGIKGQWEKKKVFSKDLKTLQWLRAGRCEMARQVKQ